MCLRIQILRMLLGGLVIDAGSAFPASFASPSKQQEAADIP
jgi:hypothetical protein